MGHNLYIDPQILFVKTSSLGDIIQSFYALDQLKQSLPNAQVDWVVEKAHAPLVAAHPLVREAIIVDFRSWKKNWRDFSLWKKLISQIWGVRKRSYDLLFDLQGNTKSGILSLCARAKQKIGFGPHSVREWPNLIGTRYHYEINKQQNICLQYASLLQQHLSISLKPFTPFRLSLSSEERAVLDALPFKEARLRVMVCPGSRWKNKQLDPSALLQLLVLMQERRGASFLLIWGSEEEKSLCLHLRQKLNQAHVVERLSFPAWQNLMWEVDLLVGVDSSALHLCGTTPTPTFSVFGPTVAHVYKPEGAHHQVVQGECPYQMKFDKVCPRLRTCPTGACIRSLTGEMLFDAMDRERLLQTK